MLHDRLHNLGNVFKLTSAEDLASGFVLLRTARVSGRLLDGDEKGVQQLRFGTSCTMDGKDITWPSTTNDPQTDTDGVFDFQVPTGLTYTFTGKQFIDSKISFQLDPEPGQHYVLGDLRWGMELSVSDTHDCIVSGRR